MLTLLTQVCLARFTELALLTFGSVERDDVISDFNVRHTLSDRFHHTTTLMS